ncbi:NUDIX domain-containing protein [Niabella terrae]
MQERTKIISVAIMELVVYIQNKPVYLCSALSPRLEQLHHRPETIFIDSLDPHTVNTMLREINLPEIKAGIFLYPDLEALKKQFFRKFERHIAGGGLVLNAQQDILMIFRRGYWDLPKGHQDPGETIEDCALREVREETGLSTLRLLRPLTVTFHTYQQGSHAILKESHWFVMQSPGTEPLLGQTEEDIEKIEWVSANQLEQRLKASYPSIAQVIRQYQDNQRS